MVECDICRHDKSFYLRPYSGEKLCRKCFVKSVEDKARTTIAKHRMFNFDETIAIALSGGKDSVSLLHILAKIEKRFPFTNLSAITIDEGIKGYRDEAIRIAKQNCSELSFHHIVISFKELFGYTLDEIVERTKTSDLTPCAYCGVLRRRAMNIAAQKVGAKKIAVGHNLDDEIQTFFLNIIHGDPLRSKRNTSSINLEDSRFPRRVKPLCEILEKEIVLFAFLKGMRFQEIPCPYAGDALRNDARTILNRLEDKRPGTKYTVYSSMQRIYHEIRTKETISINSCKICGEPTTKGTCQICQILMSL